MQRFEHLQSKEDLADFLEVPVETLCYVLYKEGIDSLYYSFEIPKKNGENRQIDAPQKPLSDIQKILAIRLEQQMQDSFTVSKVSHGFEKNKSIITNAKIHRKKRYLLSVDLQDFFPSFHFGRVKGFFQKNKNFACTEQIATILAQLTCFRGSLPQGATTSPIITNLIFRIVDRRIVMLAKKYKLDYTRYADDMTFSTNHKEFEKKLSIFFARVKGRATKSWIFYQRGKNKILLQRSKAGSNGINRKSGCAYQ